MVNWCAFLNRHKFKWVMQLGTLGIIGWLSYVFMNYTYILPLHGGGKFVGGGYIHHPLLCRYAAGK